MNESLTGMLRCPVTRTKLTLKIIKASSAVEEAILFADKDWFYPVINGVPRLNVEAFIDYADFLMQHMDDYPLRKKELETKYPELISYVIKKNKRTKESFAKEWKVYNYNKDKTWDADDEGMLQKFLTETGETVESLDNKIIFDAGCGNGKLDILLGNTGAHVIAMDFTDSFNNAIKNNSYLTIHFIQGDIQFPPVVFQLFDIVHCSGVLIHTNNSELSFSCIEPTVKPGGKLSVWVYHHRKDWLHNFFNAVRTITSRWPLSIQYYFYCITIFPLSYIIKRLKRNKQNRREMMVSILDWFTPEFRREHGDTEVASWFYKRNYTEVKKTTNELFGFNTTGTKQ